MEKLNYDGLLDRWKSDLIVRRALRMGFRPDRVTDIQQRLVSAVMEFDYCHEKSNGATERTALRSLIDNQLKKIRREDYRYQAAKDAWADMPVDSIDFETEELILDVRQGMAGLSERERKVCHWLIEGRTPHAMAKLMKCGWYTVDRIIIRIREHFESLGLNGYFV